MLGDNVLPLTECGTETVCIVEAECLSYLVRFAWSHCKFHRCCTKLTWHQTPTQINPIPANQEKLFVVLASKHLRQKVQKVVINSRAAITDHLSSPGCQGVMIISASSHMRRPHLATLTTRVECFSVFWRENYAAGQKVGVYITHCCTQHSLGGPSLPWLSLLTRRDDVGNDRRRNPALKADVKSVIRPLWAGHTYLCEHQKIQLLGILKIS